MADSMQELQLRKMMFVDLGEEERRLFTLVHQVEGGCRVLGFLYRNAHSQRTAEDIAFHVQEPLPTVEDALQRLAEMGLVTRNTIAGLDFYTFPDEPCRGEPVRSLFTWQERWRTSLSRLKQVVSGETPADEE